MERCTSYDIICSYMPQRLRNILKCISVSDQKNTNEIRIRVNKPITCITSNKIKFVDLNSTYQLRPNDCCPIVSKNEIDQIINTLCKFSVHSCARELSQGFFTIENGIRVGVSGTISTASEPTFKYISGLNFRISRQITGCAEEIFNRIFFNGRHSVLICGSVNSGKTTILRDLCRFCGNRYKVTLIDERSELAAASNGIPQLDIGLNTDILEGINRSDGIISAIRTLSPHIIVCDEISTEQDCNAIMSGFGCGVNFAATAHANSFEELNSRSVLRPLLDLGVFEYVVILDGENSPGRIREIRRLGSDV